MEIFRKIEDAMKDIMADNSIEGLVKIMVANNGIDLEIRLGRTTVMETFAILQKLYRSIADELKGYHYEPDGIDWVEVVDGEMIYKIQFYNTIEN